VTGPSGTRTYRIVGQAVMPSISDPEPLADAAVLTAAGLAKLGGDGGSNLVVRFSPDADRAAVVRRLEVIGGATSPPERPTLPAEIDRVRQIDSLPIALAVFVAVVALVAVAFALVTTGRRRRRELAILKTLGFKGGQVRATVAWHATTLAAVGLVVGIPLGLVVGRFVWQAVADELGVSSDPTWPVLGILVLIPVALLLVNLIAALPARAAARTRPAVVLRSE
jgi:predicted lysophospholipase L1 biosynthesis ABC-type transport system permease subunit